MFCPSCGRKSFEEDDNQRNECKECNFTFYRNVAAAVAVVVRCRDEVLFTIRATDPGKGMLDLPGGFVDPQESLEEAAKRELLEELRIDESSLRYLFSEPNIYRYRDVDYNTIDAFFEVQLDEKSGSRGFFSPSPHTTRQAGPHRAVHLNYRTLVG